MIRKKISVYCAIALIVFTGACQSKRVAYNVANINEVNGLRNYTTIYALPKSGIKVNVKVTKTVLKKGPFSNYAQTMLGLTDVISRNETIWEIKQVEFESFPLLDTNHVYIIETNSIENKLKIELTENSFLKAVNPPLIKNKEIEKTIEIKEFEQKKQGRSITNFNDILLPKSVLTKASSREKADELSRLILNQRVDLAATLIGDGYTETIAEGSALRIMVDEIKRLQQEYLLMFKGITKEESFDFSFEFIPDEPRKVTQTILFRFSKENGLVAKDDMSGEPVLLEIDSKENMNELNLFCKNQNYLLRAEKNGIENNGLFYRIPEKVIVRLLEDNNEIAKKDLLLPQFGVVNSLPEKYLDDNISIEFFPELGSIKKIQKLE